MHNAKFPHTTGQIPSNSQLPHYRPVSQAGQPNFVNKSFTNPQMKGQMGLPTQGESQVNPHQQYGQNKTMNNFGSFGGRFS